MKPLRRPLAAILALTVAATLSACVSSNYMGISLKPGVAAPALQQLALHARSGDKQAQLELGIAFEEGRGVPVDLDRARALYRSAASDSGGTLWVYVPPAVKGQSGRVMPFERGPRMQGLEMARRRLAALGE